MPYALRFYLYFFVVCVVVTVVGVWLRPYGFIVSIAVAAAEAYLTIVSYASVLNFPGISVANVFICFFSHCV